MSTLVGLDAGAHGAGGDLRMRSRRPARAPDLSARVLHGLAARGLAGLRTASVWRFAARVALAGLLALAQLVGAKRGEIERQAKAVTNVFAHVLGSVI